MSLSFQVTDEVQDERRKQDRKWGPQNHTPLEWMAILTEEIGEAAKEALEHHWSGTHYPVDHERLHRLRAELVQVAAVAVAMIESLDRNELATEAR
jgi:NTP pyrophosphatase (non-canonical NTP hydrolase)